MAENKLKTMNEISAADAVNWFREFLDDPEGLWSMEPAWVGEVAARDFLECLKIYTDVLYGPSGQQGAVFEEQRSELLNTLTNLPEKERGAIYGKLPPREKQAYDLLMANPTLSQKELADKFSPSISVKTLKIYLEKLRAAYCVEKTRDIFTAPKY